MSRESDGQSEARQSIAPSHSGRCNAARRCVRAPLGHLRCIAGFTFIELIAVMVIVAILAASALPVINSLSETRRSAAAKQLLRGLTVARQHAQATGATTWLEIDLLGQRWSILVENPEAPGRASATPLIDPGTGRRYANSLGTGDFAGTAITSVNFDGGSAVGFDWKGRPLNAAEQPLTAQGIVTLEGGHRVRVEAGTGYVRQ